MRPVLIAASVAALLGGTLIGSAEAAQPTAPKAGKAVTACVSSDGSVRMSPKRKSIKCRDSEDPMRIQVAAGKRAQGAEGTGAITCVTAKGRPRLNLTGTCPDGTTTVRMTFVNPKGASVLVTCISPKGRIAVPGDSGDCAPGTVSVPVTTAGELVLPASLQRPWQPVAMAPIAGATPTLTPQPSETPEQTATPEPTPTPSQDGTGDGGSGNEEPPAIRPSRGTRPSDSDACPAASTPNDYSNATLENCIFSGTDLTNATFANATLTNVWFDGATLDNADLRAHSPVPTSRGPTSAA